MRKKTGGPAGILASLALFALVLAVLLAATASLTGAAAAEGVEATRAAIERAAVLCYAGEGFYPPSLAYLEAHYGIQIDHSRYAVRYEIFAPNVAPAVRVVAR